MRSTAQICDIPQKNRLDLLHLLMYHSNRGGSRGWCQGEKMLILRGLKLRRFDQNQGNHPFKIVLNDHDTYLNYLAEFHKNLPTHIAETHAITILGPNF